MTQEEASLETVRRLSVRGRVTGWQWAIAAILGVMMATAAHAQEEVARFTRSGARNGQVFFSPDGTRISFVSDRVDGWQVWIVGSAGQDARQVTREAEPVGWPSWSADGSEILFYGRRGGTYRLLRLRLDRGEISRVDAEDWPAFRPLLDPGGTKLLFDAADPASGAQHDLWIRDLGSGELRRMTRSPAYDSDARWSPDGERIVFHSDRGEEAYHTHVFVMSIDGGAVRRVTEGAARSGYPSWSPNGDCIVYTSELDGNRDVWVVGSSGEAPRRLTWHPGFDGDPVWSPEGGRILFGTDRFEGIELAFLELPDDVARRCEG